MKRPFIYLLFFSVFSPLDGMSQTVELDFVKNLKEFEQWQQKSLPSNHCDELTGAAKSSEEMELICEEIKEEPIKKNPLNETLLILEANNKNVLPPLLQKHFSHLELSEKNPLYIMMSLRNDNILLGATDRLPHAKDRYTPYSYDYGDTHSSIMQIGGVTKKGLHFQGQIYTGLYTELVRKTNIWELNDGTITTENIFFKNELWKDPHKMNYRFYKGDLIAQYFQDVLKGRVGVDNQLQGKWYYYQTGLGFKRVTSQMPHKFLASGQQDKWHKTTVLPRFAYINDYEKEKISAIADATLGVQGTLKLFNKCYFSTKSSFGGELSTILPDSQINLLNQNSLILDLGSLNKVKKRKLTVSLGGEYNKRFSGNEPQSKITINGGINYTTRHVTIYNNFQKPITNPTFDSPYSNDKDIIHTMGLIIPLIPPTKK